MYAYTFATNIDSPPANPDELIVIVSREEAAELVRICRQDGTEAGKYYASILDAEIRTAR